METTSWRFSSVGFARGMISKQILASQASIMTGYGGYNKVYGFALNFFNSLKFFALFLNLKGVFF